MNQVGSHRVDLQVSQQKTQLDDPLLISIRDYWN